MTSESDSEAHFILPADPSPPKPTPTGTRSRNNSIPSALVEEHHQRRLKRRSPQHPPPSTSSSSTSATSQRARRALFAQPARLVRHRRPYWLADASGERGTARTELTRESAKFVELAGHAVRELVVVGDGKGGDGGGEEVVPTSELIGEVLEAEKRIRSVENTLHSLDTVMDEAQVDMVKVGRQLAALGASLDAARMDLVG